MLHIAHKRLAEIDHKAQQIGFENLSNQEKADLRHCLRINTKLVRRIEELNSLSFIAYENNDMEWLMEITRKIDELEIS